ncbi:DUF551 domain-containing protein [Escherichia coli]|uniref:DUF551 domain-containing protein n=8 Tax=Escherichia coli TaxID=562 RepID=UPI001EC5F221|nr:DUF551 domain-containing protein [Escherichia coli]EEW2443745.1 DUF551 domain-containing protein [Escherichia coli]EFN4859018.1 DUF551 domain-containing protein [Escherichia coli]EIB8347184.1 DUF551 domain-containing protein [Escherichia coli]EIQ0254211.1 DUF551 domain-containing protein [Escherichia coli]
MTTFTDKELIKEIKERIGSLDVRDNIERRAYEIALASLEAEPVAWKATFTQIDHEYNTFTAMYSDKAEAERWVRLHKVGDFRADITPLYTAKPVPVVPGEIADDLMEKLPKSDAWANGFRGGWNSCRAVMLHGAEPVSQTHKSQHTQFEQVADLYEMQFDDGRTCAFHTDAQKAAQWLQACDGNRVQEYVKLERLRNALSGNYPVTADGWISCSERMPEKGQNVLISVNFDSSLVEPLICSARYTGSTFRRGEATIKPGNGIEQATHWMPLPEPPQEVN